MPPHGEKWVSLTSVRQPPTQEAVLSFFGIPPDPPERLADNIAKKRRAWHAKTNGGNPVGRERASQVVELVQQLSEMLTRGTTLSITNGAVTRSLPNDVYSTLDELWKIVANYVLADDYAAALRVAREATGRWGFTTATASVLAWVVAVGKSTGNITQPAILTEGLYAARLAVRGEPAEPRNWESKVALLIGVNRWREAVDATEEAAAALPVLTSRLLLWRAAGLFNLDAPDDAACAAVQAVHQAGSKPRIESAVRSEATLLLVAWLEKKLLPIKSALMLSQYIELVDTAAWCAEGIPEAEDWVRAHRMWAANAGKRVFAGSWKLRSFLAVCTGFLSLPIHNWLRSAPAWQVFFDGLQKPIVDESFQIVAAPKYVQKVHHLEIEIARDKRRSR